MAIHFTGKERDIESGLDYFDARYYASGMGRFSSPDPSGLAYADLTNPQSLNLYSYVFNNPLIYTDPTGLCGGPDDDDFYGCYVSTGNGKGYFLDQNNNSYNIDTSQSVTVNADPTNTTIDSVSTNFNPNLTYLPCPATSVKITGLLRGKLLAMARSPESRLPTNRLR